MANIKQKFGTANQAITITLTSLADNGYRASAAVDNSSNCFLDCLVQLKILVSGSAPSGESVVNVWAYGSADGGDTYSGGATGSDADYGGAAGQLITNARLIGVIYCDAASETFESDLMSICNAFGGVMPDHWGIIVQNQLGAALANSGHSAFYQGVYAQSK